MGIICAFFGHRDFNEKYCPALEVEIRNVIRDYGITTFWCGGYGAFDSCAARAMYKLKAKEPDIKLFLIQAYLPKSAEELPPIYDGSSIRYQYDVASHKEYSQFGLV